MGLATDEEAVIVEIDKDGDFKLKNTKGAISRFFQPRKRYVYKDINYEAPVEDPSDPAILAEALEPAESGISSGQNEAELSEEATSPQEAEEQQSHQDPEDPSDNN